MGTDSFVFAANITDIPPGKCMPVEIAGHDILICRHKSGNEVFAVANLCSHAMAKLEGGKLRSFRLICPLHGGAFDVRDGTAIGKPATLPITTYPLRIKDECIEVQINHD